MRTSIGVLAAALFVLWVFGVVMHVGGGLIHLLVAVALMFFIYELVLNNRRYV
jgi:hypothetical protein